MLQSSIPLEKTIELLLHRYECVILPGFGGFIVRDSPCNFNAGKDQVKPFARHIFFNTHLKENDGLLSKEIEKQENLSYSEANEHCRKAIEDLRNGIEAAGSMRFGNLGTFFKGQENIWFAPSPTLNLSLESYGLEPVNVHKVTSEETVVKQIEHTSETITHADADRKPIETIDMPKPGLRPWLIAASLALLVHFVYLGLEKPENNDNQASVVPELSVPLMDSFKSSEIENDSAIIAPDSTALYSNQQSQELSANVLPETPAKAVSDTPVIREEIVKPAASETHSQPATAELANASPDGSVIKEHRVARYKLEINAAYHVKDLIKQGISSRVEFIDGWYEVVSEDSTEQ